jgi:DNA-binding GntR family transcriptional regulator
VIQYDAKPDLKLLRVRFSGHVTKEEAEKGVDHAAKSLTAMAREFRLLADLSTLSSMDVACAPFIERVMDLCQEHGIAEIIRIIPDPSRDIGLGIMSRFHYQNSVRIFTCSTQEEAFNLLSSGDDLDPGALRAALA